MTRLTGAAKPPTNAASSSTTRAAQSPDAAVLIRAAVHAGAHHTCGNSHTDPGDCLACEWVDQ